ncbi:NAD(P)H-dependent flavin oxidoreductase [Chachezhania sediminis]|uniref:NAD(P)H-dependent flavin oxidoreductase n=1 Tax=Chachezhania sediminis TaxID=2599291 RepID=UPI00131A9EEC|nr:nitronate monooxygenase [Chachezhania sediminis]
MTAETRSDPLHDAYKPLFETRLTRLFGMRHPVMVGGMMFHSRADFVAACARAGTMAFLTAKSCRDARELRANLTRCTDLAEGAPWGLNLSISRFRPNDIVDAALDLAAELGITRFETSGSFPGDVLRRIHDMGGVVIHKATQLRHAIKAAEGGADALIVVGAEAGGHPGTNPHPSHVILAELLKHTDVPVAIGGGIGTGRQILGALAQGADAAVVVSRLLTATEIRVHDNYRTRMVQAGIDDSIVVLGSIKDTWRVLRNATSEWVAAREKELGDTATHAAFGEVLKGAYAREHAYAGGDMDRGMMSCSSAVAHADRIAPAGDILYQLMRETDEAARALANLAHRP